MNTYYLKSFLTVRKHLNYTHAAQELFLSQPAVSRQMRALESEMGAVLFEQIGKSLHLTQAGKILELEAERLLGDMDRARERVRAHQSGQAGFLRLGASTTPGLYLLPSILGSFRKKQPNLEFRFLIENSHSIEQRIIANEIDLGFVGVPLGNDAIREEPLVDDEILLFAAPSHPLVGRGNLSPQELAGETWITRERGSATRRLFEQWLSRKGCSIRKVMEVQSPEGIKALVRAGLGISYHSSFGLADEIRRGILAALRVEGTKLVRPIYLVRHRRKYLSPLALAFVELVHSRLAKKARR